MAKAPKENKDEPLEKQLWKAADKLRKNIDAAEYKHVVMGLIFLKYISDSFEEMFAKLQAGEGEMAGADPEDKDEYKAENVFFVPSEARWSFLVAKAKLPIIGTVVDEAMDAIEKENPSLKGVLPKVFARQNLDPASLGGLIDLVGNIALGDAKSRSADVLGHVFEYFLGEFALAEGKQGGQFYTPRSIVELLVMMLEPYKGRVFDPCCGSGGMFVQSEKFVGEHQGKVNDISIYGQESNQTTWRLAKMNLAIRGIDSSQVKWNNEGSFLNDAHKDLKADFIIANPPFNDSDWSGDILRNDGRWKYGTPPASNANFAWIQHFLYHLSPNGKAGFVLADTSLSTPARNESEIRQEIVKSRIVDCIVALPSHLFSNTQITACIWIIDREKSGNVSKTRTDEVLFIDASKLGKLVERRNRVLANKDVLKISEKYHLWKNGSDSYADEPGFCKSIHLEVVSDNNFVLSPNRYIEPIKHDVTININFDDDSIENAIQRLSNDIGDVSAKLLDSISTDEPIKVGDAKNLNRLSIDLLEFSGDLYKALIKKYFIELNSSDFEAPDGWEKKEFGELFVERKIRVGTLGYCPSQYSVTNNGIQHREGKFSKELSANTSSYKVAFEGDMVFGLSREIPNLDVFQDKQGAFSGAYHIFAPKDVRVGLLIGSIMRLKLLEQTDILKGGAREGRGLDKDKLLKKTFLIPSNEILDSLWGVSW
jgi:type I restriction enzyme M protein